MIFPHIRIVLVSPQGALNIGSVSRIMMNFGFDDLRIVNPRVDHLGKQAQDMAVSAKETILKNARVHDCLQDALQGCHLVIGTSTRQGKYRKEVMEPAQLSELQAQLPIDQQLALVFGPEDHGLTTADLDLCHSFITIKTSAELHSLNLAQAVTICLYELAKKPLAQEEEKRRERAPFEELEGMLAHMKQSFSHMNYLNPQNPDHIIHTYRRIFSRAELDCREILILHGLWSRIDYLNKSKSIVPDKGLSDDV